jgi:acetyltransferase
MIRLSQLIADVGEDSRTGHQPAACRCRRGDRARCAHRRAAAGEGTGAGGHFAIRPYPVELEAAIEHRGERLRIRPIRPDEALLQRFIRHLTAEDIRLRFFGPLRELTHEMAARLTQIDYDREMASSCSRARNCWASDGSRPILASSRPSSR